MNYTLKISDWSVFPGGRFPEDGPNSAEEYREKILRPCVDEAIENDSFVLIDLDHTRGYGSNFLEEAFGGLLKYYTNEDLHNRIKIKSWSNSLKSEIWEYVDNPRKEFLERIKKN